MRLVLGIDRLAFLLCLPLFFAACGPEEESPVDGSPAVHRSEPYVLAEPARFVSMDIPADNPLTQAGVALGRSLFFDPILSMDSSLSCAGCHRPERAFTDGLPVSRGIGGRLGMRNAPSLLNIGYQTNGLFWDGRVATLEELVVHPVQDTNEMGHRWDVLLHQLRDHPTYPTAFRQAFGIETADGIDQRHTAQALAQFLRTLVSGDTRYDRYKAGQVKLSPAEDRGRRIFFDIEDGVPASECGHCHVEPLFSGMEYFNNGLDRAEDISDPGRGGISGRKGETGSFRTPGLRNVALTAPYMHDGRFSTLEEVIDHYVEGGKYGENVHPNVRKLDFTERDKADLIAFLNTLTEVRLTERAYLQK